MAVNVTEVSAQSTDTAPTTETALPEPTDSGAEVERPSDGAEANDSPAPDPEGSEVGEGDDDPDEQPRTDEERKLSRSERRKLREQERIDRAVEERMAERERAAEAKRVQDEAEARAKQAAESFHKEFGDLIGHQGEAERLQREINELVAQTVAVDPMEADQAELDRLTKANADIKQRQARLREIAQNAETYTKLDRYQFQATQNSYLKRAESLPPSHQQALLGSTTIEEALTHLEAGIVAREAAKAKAAQDAAVARVQGELDKERAAHAATRSGVPGDGPAPNTGNGLPPIGTYTRERLRQMMQTPEGLAEYRRNRAEIERQEAAGLIR